MREQWLFPGTAAQDFPGWRCDANAMVPHIPLLCFFHKPQKRQLQSFEMLVAMLYRLDLVCQTKENTLNREFMFMCLVKHSGVK